MSIRAEETSTDRPRCDDDGDPDGDRGDRAVLAREAPRLGDERDHRRGEERERRDRRLEAHRCEPRQQDAARREQRAPSVGEPVRRDGAEEQREEDEVADAERGSKNARAGDGK